MFNFMTWGETKSDLRKWFGIDGTTVRLKQGMAAQILLRLLKTFLSCFLPSPWRNCLTDCCSEALLFWVVSIKAGLAYCWLTPTTFCDLYYSTTHSFVSLDLQSCLICIACRIPRAQPFSTESFVTRQDPTGKSHKQSHKHTHTQKT